MLIFLVCEELNVMNGGIRKKCIMLGDKDGVKCLRKNGKEESEIPEKKNENVVVFWNMSKTLLRMKE